MQYVTIKLFSSTLAIKILCSVQVYFTASLGNKIVPLFLDGRNYLARTHCRTQQQGIGNRCIFFIFKIINSSLP